MKSIPRELQMVFLSVLFLAGGGCTKTERETTTQSKMCGFETFFSFANQDRQAPIVLTDATINGVPLFHGALQPTFSGDYVYVHTWVFDQRMDLEVKSDYGGKVITARKNIWVKDRTWVVVTRTREYDGDPKLRIEVSYEVPYEVPSIY
jgi:hypothetical protein